MEGAVAVAELRRRDQTLPGSRWQQKFKKASLEVNSVVLCTDNNAQNNCYSFKFLNYALIQNFGAILFFACVIIFDALFQNLVLLSHSCVNVIASKQRYLVWR